MKGVDFNPRIIYNPISLIELSKKGVFVVEQYNITLKDGFGGAQKREKTPASIPEKTSWYYFGLVGQIGYSIAVPLAGGVIVGNLIDRRFGTSPHITMLGLGIGMVLSGISFFHIIQDSLKK